MQRGGPGGHSRSGGAGRHRTLRVAIYTAPLFKTSNDADNRASVAAAATEALDLVGIGIHADRKIADKVINGLKFFV